MCWAEQLQLNYYIKERDLGRVEGGVGCCGLEEEEPQCAESVHTHTAITVPSSRRFS